MTIVGSSGCKVNVSRGALSLDLLHTARHPSPRDSVNGRDFTCLVCPRSNSTISTRVGSVTFRFGVPLAETSISYRGAFSKVFLRTVGLSRSNRVIIIHLSRRGNEHNGVGFPRRICILGVLRSGLCLASRVSCGPFRVVAVNVLE